jgi:deltex-like protein
VYGVFEGDQPDGTMDVGYSHTSLPGYEGCGSYVITYTIPNGRQGHRHPKPGHTFTGTKRQAFLPATKEGKTVLKMLIKAFDMKLTFTVGNSHTTGQEDCVTWNDIHHKTSISGGPQK